MCVQQSTKCLVHALWLIVSQANVYRLMWKMTEAIVSVSMCANINFPFSELSH